MCLDHQEKNASIYKTLKPRAAKRFLRRLNERGTFWALASDMENGVIMRTTADGQTMRVAIIGRAEAQAMALKDWISITKAGRVSKYQITAAGECALKRMLSEDAEDNLCVDSHSNIFAEQHRDWGEGTKSLNRREVRCNDVSIWPSLRLPFWRVAKTKMGNHFYLMTL